MQNQPAKLSPTKLFLLKIERKYYGLSYWPRHIVGVLILLTILGGIGGIGYGLFEGGAWVYDFAKSRLFTSDRATDHVESTEEYSRFSLMHYEFPLTPEQKHPKRMTQLAKDFKHVNDVHLSAAIKLGIRPLGSRDEVETCKNYLAELKDTRYYLLDNLTHSVPYLVPKAADFLTSLGRLMQEYNGTNSRYIITSVLRTQKDVKSLGHVNGNASKNSVHCYGTTVDITYNRFDVHGKTNEGQLKLDLSRALYDLQEAGYCYVKYEIKQACFHITVRP